jgi:hypothetical protein
MAWGALGSAVKQGFMQSDLGQRIDTFRHPGGTPTSGVGSLPMTQPTMQQMPMGVGQPQPLEQQQPPNDWTRMLGALMMKPKQY